MNTKNYSTTFEKLSNKWGADTVDRLLLKGLVEKHVSSQDHRLVDVLITEKGQELLHSIQDDSEIISAVMENVSEKEMESLSDLLDKIREKRKNWEWLRAPIKNEACKIKCV